MDRNAGYQSTRHTVISTYGHVVTRSTRHRRIFSQIQLITRSSRHTVILSQASTVQSYEWAMLNYAGEADEMATVIQLHLRQDTPVIRPQN